MAKTNFKFVFDIIDGQIDGYREEYTVGMTTYEETSNKVDALVKLKDTLLVFIKESNKLTGDTK